MHIIFDITLLVVTPWRIQPSGVDRVEMAYARYCRNLPKKDVTFVMRNAWYRMAVIPDALARAFLDLADEHIAPGLTKNRFRLWALTGFIVYAQFFGIGRLALFRRLNNGANNVFITVSSANLHLHKALNDFKKRGCKIVALVHDIIPITHPQYCPKFLQYVCIDGVVSLSRYCDRGIIVSEASLTALQDYAADNAISLPPMTVAHPGMSLPIINTIPQVNTTDPYFLILGTVEPRKNHLMLLQIWQEMCKHPNAPRLVIVGRLFEEPHLAILTIERTDFRGRVQYLGRLHDDEVSKLLHAATALLFPTINEGFGIPLAEALAAGVPAIVSDIAVFRELGKDVPEFIDPLDGPAWTRAILEYAQPSSVKRAAQIARMKNWTAPNWEAHFKIVENVLQQIEKNEK